MEKTEILNTKLTAINDEIRELSGSEGTLGLDAMADKVRGGNDEIALQTQLLEQAYAELQGKVDPELYENGYAEGYAQGDIDGQQKGYDKALAEGYIKPSGTLEITENNKEYDVASYEKANVAVAVENKLAQLMNKTITEVTEEDFGGATEIGQYAFYQCKALTRVTIPNNITKIDNYAFYSCSSITKINIPDSVTRIESGVFTGCKALTSIVIPDSVKNINSNAFSSCSGITSVTIGNGITNLAYTVFNNCTALKLVRIEALKPPTIQSDTFKNVPADCAFYVPADSVEAYKTATNWSARADYIFAIEEE